MKNIFNIALALSAVFLMQSCDPLDDTYAELDKGSIDQSGKRDIELELVPADYDLLKNVSGAADIVSKKSFLNEDLAKEFIPNILSSKYPYLGEKASAAVVYDLGNISLALNQNFTAFTMQPADYTAIGLSNPNLSSSANISRAAAYVLPQAVQGDVVELKFKWYPGKNPTIDSVSNVVYLNNTWCPAYTLADKDYTTMLQAFNNFSSTTLANQYIPVFIASKFPYRMVEGDVLPVIYTLSVSGANGGPRVITKNIALLKYTNGNWLVNNGTSKAMLKFSKTKGVWLADNTVKYTITTDEHKTMIGPLVINEAAKASIIQYGNFDLKLFDKREDLVKYLGLFAKAKFPQAQVDQKYLLTYRTHNPSGTATMWLILGADGVYTEVEE